MVEPDRPVPGKSELAAIVLAGGLSTRLGRDKAFLDIDGQVLLERVVTRLEGISREVLVITSERGRELIKENGLKFGRDVSVITDLYPGKGSLGGIYSGLAVSPVFHNLVVACDMPFLNVGLLKYMSQQAPGFDVVMPRIGGVLEPLHAIYSKNCLGPIKHLLDQGNLKIIDIIDLFPKVNVRFIEEDEIAPFDPHQLSFFNINTAADFQKAQELQPSAKVGN